MKFARTFSVALFVVSLTAVGYAAKNQSSVARKCFPTRTLSRTR